MLPATRYRLVCDVAVGGNAYQVSLNAAYSSQDRAREFEIQINWRISGA
jgi:hypothetical protein